MSCCHPSVFSTSPLSAEDEARCQARRLRHFYQHVSVFFVVIAALATVNLLTRPDHLWFQWPAIGWGIWLVLHAARIFLRDRWLGREWEEAKVREILQNRR